MLRRCLLLALLVLLSGAGPVQARPNVVVIETDDQTVHDLSRMPRTKALLAREGTSFDQSVVSLSQCCPSRATVLTGQYAHNHRVLTTQAPLGGFDAFEDRESLAVWLRRAGYRTGIVGKYLNQYGHADPTYVPPGWTDWRVLLGPSVYRYYGYTLNENGRLRSFPGVYQTYTLTELALDVLRRDARAGKPFFLWTTYVAPHIGTPHGFMDERGKTTVPPPLLLPTGSMTAKLPRPLSFDERDVSDKPLDVQRLKRIRRGGFGREQRAWRQRQAALSVVDVGVERIVDELRRLGELRDTVILFTSDNGFMEGQHRIRQGKVVPYEPSIRVPLLLRGPGIPRGARRDQLVFNGDIAPTILQLTGARAPWPMDGRSLLPVARGTRRADDRAVVLEGPPAYRNEPVPSFLGLRTSRYTYVEHADGEVELYDLRTDPGQLENLRDPELRRRLHLRLRELRDCRGAACRR